MNGLELRDATNYRCALEVLDNYRAQITEGTALVMVHTELGRGQTDYLRVIVCTIEHGRVEQVNLTWALGHALGYALRDRHGYWHLAISGGGYSKSFEVVYALANHYGVDVNTIRTAGVF